MQVQLRGGRTTDEAWLKAQRAPLEDLPGLTDDDRRDARSGNSSDEQYARRMYAEQLAEPELAEKAGKVGRLVWNWLAENGIEGTVDFVKFDTLRGLFQVRVDGKESQQRIEILEDTVDDLLRSGSRAAVESIDRLLAANFGRLFISKAS